VVIYGIGSIVKNRYSQLQLALILLLKQQYDFIGEIYINDPILSELEYSVMTALGCIWIKCNENGRRHAYKPTIFYIPHCTLLMMKNFLGENIKP